MPDRPVSMGNVTRCSDSSGEYPGVSVLICTCTLVMSGVASMGSLVKLHAPTAISANVSTSISQRWAMAKRMVFSSMAGLLVIVRSAGLLDVRLHHVALLDHHLVARLQARQHLHPLRVALAQFQRPRLVG